MSIIKDSLYGFVIGDAMGVPIEFKSREYLKKNPVNSMIGYGSYNIPNGVWSDDTSLTLATIDSIIVNNGKIKYNHIADCFCEWMNHAKYTATGEVFDIGITTKYALFKYSVLKGDATKCGGIKISENGNGSLMRMLPIAWYCYFNNLNNENILDVVWNTSAITHAHEISIMGCYIYVRYLLFLLEKKNKFEAYQEIQKLNYNAFSKETQEVYQKILKTNIQKLSLNDIKSSGYIVDTLEAVLWIILNNNSFNESIICAINLGEDTDTIGAISGSISGLLYGYNSINKEWINDLKRKELLDKYIYDFDKLINIKN